MNKAAITSASSAVRPRRWFNRYEAVFLAAAPGLGVLLALLDQFGRYAFLDVPPNFIELSPGKVVVATVGVLVMAGSYVTLWAEELRGRRLVTRLEIFGSHLFVNSTLALWLVLIRIDGFWQQLPSAAAIALGLTLVTYWGHMLGKRSKWAARGEGAGPAPTNVAMFAFCAIVAIVCVVAGSSYNSERKQPYRLVVQGADVIFVGTYEGQYILKPFDRSTMSLVPGAVSLQAPAKQLNLQMVNLDLQPAHGR